MANSPFVSWSPLHLDELFQVRDSVEAARHECMAVMLANVMTRGPVSWSTLYWMLRALPVRHEPPTMEYASGSMHDARFAVVAFMVRNAFGGQWHCYPAQAYAVSHALMLVR